MDEKITVQLSLPLSPATHQKIKILTSVQKKTVKGLILELLGEYFQRPENEKILANVR